MDFKGILSKTMDVALPIVQAFVPGSGLAIQGIKAIASVFGLKEDEVTPEKLQELAAQDKDFALKMMQADQMFQLNIMKEETERMRLELADVKDARGMNIEGMKATGKRDINLYVLAYLYVSGFFISTGVMIWAVCTNHFPEDLPQAAVFLLGNLFGALTAGVGAVVQYFFGSCKSSQDKTDIIARSEPIK